MNCREMKMKLADLLLDPNSATSEALRHLEECGECREELAELRSTMTLMDDWATPEPSPFFDAKLLARLRAEQDAPPAGVFARWKWWFQYGSKHRMRPLMAGALGLVILVGGGTYADVAWHSSAPPESATLHDLQSLDSNAEVFQQLDSVDQATDQQNQDSGTPASSPSND
jgi:hypothetical protein